MRKMIFTIAAVMMLAIGAAAQTTEHTDGSIGATTEDGRHVILNADGTWAFAAANDAKPKKLGVTMAGFNALENGMSYEDAAAILGRAGEKLSESELGGVRTVMYQWKADRGSLGANMNAMFQDGKLILKAQAGLK